MDIEALRSLIAFVDTGSLTRAAKQMHRTQSALSMQMKKLEQELGKTLFVKEGRNLSLSKDGQALARYAHQLISLHDEAFSVLSASGAATRIRFACPDDYAQLILPKLVPLLHHTFPNLALEIACLPSNLIRNKLDEGALDLAVVTRSSNREEGFLVYQDEGIWVHNNTHLLTQPTLPLVTFQSDCRFYQAAIEGLLKIQRPYHLMASCLSLAAMKSLVENGLAVAAMARTSAIGLSEATDFNLPPLPKVQIALLPSNKEQSVISHALAQKLSVELALLL